MLTGRKADSKILYGVVALMALAASVWLGYQFWRLLFQAGEMGAIDLLKRHLEVRSLVAERPIYELLRDAVYPPASYLLLWPLVGWLNEALVRYGWALTTVMALVVTQIQILRVVRPVNAVSKAFWLLLPLSMYATGATIGNGQLIVHIVPCLLGCLLLLDRSGRSWQQTALLVALTLFALVKPNATAPFFWLLILRAPLAAGVTALTYGLLTAGAALFQPGYGPVTLFQAWLTAGMSGIEYGSTAETYIPEVQEYVIGYGSLFSNISIHSVLSFYNLGHWNKFASLAVLAALGLWLLRYRNRDIWILASLAALVSKFWTYQGWYDDLVLIIPLIALYRIWISGSASNYWRARARDLFALVFVFTLAPGGIYLFPAPFNLIYLLLQTLVLALVATLMLLLCLKPDIGCLRSAQAQSNFEQRRV